MSKRGYISRYLLIIKKLKVKPYSTYEELHAYIESQFEYLQMQDDTLRLGISKRTLQRDLREISNMFGIDIAYSKARKGYYLVQSDAENMNFQRMVEVFDLFHSLNLAQDVTPFVHLEQRRPKGTEHLYGLLYAIKNGFRIQFTYQKFGEEGVSQRTVEPIALKEFRNRWYVLAKDTKDNAVKNFALDRLTQLEITTQRYQYPDPYSAEQSYRYCFGIIGPNDSEPQDIILSFEPFQGKYIKTLPLHETQQLLVDNDKETLVKLRLYLTHDFVMELLSFGDKVKVIEPKKLAEQIRTAHKSAYEQY